MAADVRLRWRVGFQRGVHNCLPPVRPLRVGAGRAALWATMRRGAHQKRTKGRDGGRGARLAAGGGRRAGAGRVTCPLTLQEEPVTRCWGRARREPVTSCCRRNLSPGAGNGAGNLSPDAAGGTCHQTLRRVTGLSCCGMGQVRQAEVGAGGRRGRPGPGPATNDCHRWQVARATFAGRACGGCGRTWI